MNEPFIVALASPEPAPGGGAAAGYTANLGVALLKKVIRLEILRSRTSAELTSLWTGLLNQAAEMGETLDLLIEEDSRAYAEFIEARTDCRRRDFTTALDRAVECPVRIMKQCTSGMQIALEAGRICGRHLVSDLLVSGESFLAANRGAYHIAWANICQLPGSSPQRPAISTAEITLLRIDCQEKYESMEEQLRIRIAGKGRC